MKSLGFIKESDNTYRLSRNITENDIISMSKKIMQKRFAKGKPISHPADFKEFLSSQLLDREREVFLVVYLDNRHRVIKCIEEFQGDIDQCAIYPRVIVQHALQLNCAACILSHNHPSGVSDPSEADYAITQKIKHALNSVDIRLLDHFVIGSERIVSLAESGRV